MRTRRTYLLGFFTVVVGAGNLHGDSQPEIRDLEAAKVAWQKRHDQVRSARVSFTEDLTIHREHYLKVYRRFKDWKDKVPDSDVHDVRPSVATIQGNNFKFTYTGVQWSYSTRKLEPLNYAATSNPGARNFFFDKDSNSDKRPQLSRSNSRESSDETLLKLVPLMLAIRSQQSNHRKLADYQLTGEIVAVEGRDCAELRNELQKGKTEYMYLDPERDWVVRRIDGFEDGKLVRRIIAEYGADPVVGWLPSSWSYVTRSPNGSPDTTGRVTVGKFEINTAISDDEFYPKPPPGTFVVDDTKGRGKETVSIVKSDGSPGVELPLSERPTDERLLLANNPPSRRTWRYWLLAGALVFGIATLSWYRYGRRAGISSVSTTNSPTPRA
jgi:hypothetical protein